MQSVEKQSAASALGPPGRSTPSERTLGAAQEWSIALQRTVETWGEMLRPAGLGVNITAGITTALVALPLNLALAIACGLPPGVGLVTGAVAGVLGALFSGSRLQVTGPEVALTPLTLAIVTAHGLEGLFLATFLAGLIQIALGLLRVGRWVSLIPVPVVGGFMAAVGLLVFDSQLPRFFGITQEVGFVSELRHPDHLAIANPWVPLVGVFAIVVLLGLPRLTKRIPAPLMALCASALLCMFLPGTFPSVPEIHSSFPTPSLPHFSLELVVGVAPAAIALALLASIDSLLCAASVDARVGGERARNNQELVAQGVANLFCACVGGMPVAAAVVRSMAAIEAGATTRMAPLVQSITLAIVLLLLGALVAHVPIVALAAVLLVVGYRLIDWRGLRRLMGRDRAEAGVFVVTAAGILLTDFVTGVGLGIAAATAHFAYRQALTLRVLHETHEVEGRSISVHRVQGPLFFAVRARFDEVFEQAQGAYAVVLELTHAVVVDASAMATFRAVLQRWRSEGTRVTLCHACGGTSDVARYLHQELTSHPASGRLHIVSSLDEALSQHALEAREGDADGAARREVRVHAERRNEDVTVPFNHSLGQRPG